MTPVTVYHQLAISVEISFSRETIEHLVYIWNIQIFLNYVWICSAMPRSHIRMFHENSIVKSIAYIHNAIYVLYRIFATIIIHVYK